MAFELVVVRSFGPYAVGDRVTDATAIAGILASEHAANIVRVTASNGAGGGTAPAKAKASAAKEG